MMNPIAALIIQVLEFYKWIVIIAVIVSWLTAFNAINDRNQFVSMILRVLYAMTEPVFRPVRRVLPSLGGPRPVAHRGAVRHLVHPGHDPVSRL